MSSRPLSQSTLFVGLMSGTSMDAVDAVLVDFGGLKPELLADHSQTLPDALREVLIALNTPGGVNELELAAQLDLRVAHLFADTTRNLLRKAGVAPARVCAIGSHGQTVRHQPHGPEPFTIQLGNPAFLAEHTGITTVADFRRRDIAAGGQGAPLVPAFHHAVFHAPLINRVIVNIGGMANITILPADAEQPVGGLDTGPGNVLMDAWAQLHQGARFDAEGRWAEQGKILPALLDTLLADPYFALPPPKSTGRERFNLPWLEAALASSDTLSSAYPQDVQATLCELTARSIALAIGEYAPLAEQVLVCGGGAHNQTLMNSLRAQLATCQVDSTASYGIEPDWVEAMAFAWLAKQALEGKPGNLPSVTGARRAVILGGIYKA